MFPNHKTLQYDLAREELAGAARCIGVLLLIVVFGTLGFWFIEHENNWDLWKSLFFTLITITTVGYGDQGLSVNGERFAAVLLLFGIGAATYSLTSLVQIVVTYQAAWKRKMQRKIDRLSEHYIICGFGRIGRTVAEQLKNEGAHFVIVDHDEDVLQQAVDHGYLAMRGNSTEEEVLLQAGIERANGLICATSSDAENVFVTLCATELNPKAFIASRAGADNAARKMEKAGADLVVSPYTTAGQNIADAILRPNLARFLNRHRSGNVELGEFTVDNGSALIGETVCQIGETFPNIVFVAIRQGEEGEQTRPGGEQVFQTDDIVTVAGPSADLASLYAKAQMTVLA